MLELARLVTNLSAKIHGRLGFTCVKQPILTSAVSAFVFFSALGLVKNALGQQLTWAKRAGGVESNPFVAESGFGIAVDGSGSTYVTGQFSSSAIFGAGEVNETTLVSAGVIDRFVSEI